MKCKTRLAHPFVLSLCAVLVSASAALAAPCPLFPGEVIHTGFRPKHVAIGDLDGDGAPDLVTANQGENSISVLLGNGNGTFQPSQSYPASGITWSVLIGDLNGDGIPDLVVVTGNNIRGRINVRLGNGDGTFQDAKFFESGLYSGSGAIGDFNGDGLPDLAVTNPNYKGDGFVSVLLGNGDGTFQPRQDFPAGLNPVEMAIGDLNGDGTPDLALADFHSNLGTLYSHSGIVLLGNGDGTFQPPQVLPTDLYPRSVAIGDLDGDGIPDLAFSNYQPFVSVRLGNGDGTFQTPQNIPTPNGSYSVAIGDLSGDGIPDLVACNEFESSIFVMLGHGDGTFQTPQIIPTGAFSVFVAIGDLDGDGAPDLALANDDNTVGVLLGNGDGTFQTLQDFPAGLSPLFVAIGDLDGDGAPDLATANLNSASVSVLLGDGEGDFQPSQDLPTGYEPRSVAIGDLDGDGTPDLVVANGGSDSVSVLLGHGDGGFEPRIDSPAGFRPENAAIGDFNGDGDPDLAVANLGPPNQLGNTVGVLLGNGDGTFQTPSDLVVGLGPALVAVSDLNGDGTPDLAVPSSSFVSVLLGNGDGTFQARQDFDTGLFPSSLAIDDLNGDGAPDLVFGHAFVSPGYVSVLLNNGDGTFGPLQNYDTGGDPRTVAIGDFDGDGAPDLVVAHNTPSPIRSIGVLMGNGDGTFQTRRDFRILQTFTFVTVGDLDADGAPDLVLSRSGVESVSVLLNQCVSAPSCPADLNGDGVLNFFDVSAFLAGFNAMDPVADFNGNGDFNFFDVSAFLQAFNAGCP